MSATTIVIHDPVLLAKLAEANGRIVFQGPTGDPVKTVETVRFANFPPGFKIPFTDEQLAEFSKVRTGRLMADVIKELKEKHGE